MKLSKSTCYAINWLYANGKSIEEISDELDIKTDNITKYIEKNNIQNSIEIANKSEPVKSKNLMIRHTAEKKTNNVSIMTKEASTFNDSQRSKVINGAKNLTQCIFKPNEQ